MREFNVQTDTYGAADGKRAGGQISVVTSSGTNQVAGGGVQYFESLQFLAGESDHFRWQQCQLHVQLLGGPDLPIVHERAATSARAEAAVLIFVPSLTLG